MYQKTVLQNGLRIVTSDMPHVRSMSICVFVGSGSRYEAPEQAGISHFVEHLLFKGTKNRPTAREIAEAIEGIGGILNGGTDKEMTIYWAKVAGVHFKAALNVLGDMICCSKFDPDDIEKERRVIIEEINMSLDLPSQRVNMLIDEAIWPDQALGRDVAGGKETVSVLTRQALLDYQARQYIPSGTVISVAGGLHHDETVQSVIDVLGDWIDSTPGRWFPANDYQSEPCILLEPKDTEQIHLCLALRGLSSFHDDRYVLDLLNIILGEGMSCRLFLELREKRGLVYDVHSYVSHYYDSGALTIYSGIEPGNLEFALEVILGELSRLKTESIPDEEVMKAKEMVKGRLMLQMEDTRSVAGWIGGQELLRGEIKTVDEIVSLIDAITADDLRRVAQNLFNSKGLNLAMVGPVCGEERIQHLVNL